jgi:hypothetical protein
MEIGDSGLIPVGEGRWLDSNSGYQIDQDGRVYDSDGQLIEDNYYDDEE